LKKENMRFFASLRMTVWIFGTVSVIPATICDPPDKNLANIQYATDYRNFFKECMVRNGFLK
jgi:hypothetical protein